MGIIFEGFEKMCFYGFFKYPEDKNDQMAAHFCPQELEVKIP